MRGDVEEQGQAPDGVPGQAGGPGLPALDWAGDDRARAAGVASEEALVLLLLRAVRHFASGAADGNAVAPVSTTLDHTADLAPGAPLDFAMTLDRRTRTLVFAHGAARQGDSQVLTATVVYRIG